MNADGSDVRRLTDHPADDYWPTWSPDGSQIAFASERDGNFEIYVMRVQDVLQGTGDGVLRRLTNSSGDDLEPAWSPSGSQIAFMHYSAGQSAIYVMPAPGPETQVDIIDTLQGTDGSNQRRLTDSDGNDWLPAWSPAPPGGGAQLAFVSDRDGNAEIYVMDVPLDGGDTNPRRLTDNDAEDSYPAWSPDGTLISFYSTRDGSRELYVMPVDGGAPRPLTHDDASVWVSAWSPDGTKIAFTSARDGNRELYVMPVDGGNLQRLTRNRILDGIPAWRPEPSAADSGAEASSAALGETRTRPADDMAMVYVPGGAFPMGSTTAEIEDALARCRKAYRYCNYGFYGQEAPQHAVTLDSFWLDQTAVTNAQYHRCVQAGICQAPPACGESEPALEDPSRAEHPVVCVNWHDARAYCVWAGARLPTEAEWEYAARGPEGYRYPWGDEPGGAWQNYCDFNCTESWADEAVDDGYALTSPAGSYPQGASWCGAQDLAGNVYEWVADWKGDYSSAPQTNPTGPATGSERVLRSSSWLSFWDRARGATRDSVSPENRAGHIGFRCAMTVED
jgi:formylglycine-generating enzyme required for sulfatase activity